MNSIVHASTATKISRNNRIIRDDAASMRYDGEMLDVVGHSHGEQFALVLTNDDIVELLSQPASNVALEMRLKRLLTPASQSKKKLPKSNKHQKTKKSHKSHKSHKNHKNRVIKKSMTLKKTK